MESQTGASRKHLPPSIPTIYARIVTATLPSHVGAASASARLMIARGEPCDLRVRTLSRHRKRAGLQIESCQACPSGRDRRNDGDPVCELNSDVAHIPPQATGTRVCTRLKPFSIPGTLRFIGQAADPWTGMKVTVKLRLGFELSCAGVLPRTTQAKIVIILVIMLFAWSLGGTPAVQVLTGAI